MVVATQQQTKRPKQETAPMVNVKFKLRSDEHRLNLKLTILNLFKFPSTTRSNDLTAKTQIKRKQPMN